jgi:hypothetical protein
METTELLQQQVRQMLGEVTGVKAVSNGTEAITMDVPFKIIHGPDPDAFIVQVKRDELPSGINYAQFRRQQRLLERTLGDPVGLYLDGDHIVITNPETERALDAIRRLVPSPVSAL